ncbi:IMPACT family protein [Tenacibaculum finnmarkense]|uniref:IMPACT family protein n=1 Tax=Tenacibaculum finnmarkense TaxID=2781243 RepID=UPI000AE19E7D|nr:YigZ family protein [Tenacibaculum finnmarkense]MCD8410554.1 YigZ family protein [Tenacibaculum finnmarkense genomovar ulcerans]
MSDINNTDQNKIKDTYKTIDVLSEETLFKDRNSKFFGYAFPVSSEEQVKEAIEGLRKKHHTARHFCYAWQFGIEAEKMRFRANDDGEPSNSAGMPIYGQIQAFDVTNILIVSVRYFGGTKLGVGGLINAYRTSAKMALEIADIKEKTIDIDYQLNFGYDMMNKVQRVVKEKNLNITAQKLEMDCEYIISVRKKDAQIVFDIFDNLFKVSIKRMDEQDT